MSTWRALPVTRRVGLALMALCVVAVGAQLYRLAADVTEPTPTASFDAADDEPGARTDVPTNEFIPVDRDISECISAIPKPGCGSEARGGWHQSLVLLAILVGLALIVWRIVAGARAAKASQGRHVTADH